VLSCWIVPPTVLVVLVHTSRQALVQPLRVGALPLSSTHHNSSPAHQPINLAVVADGHQRLPARQQVYHTYRLQVQQVCDALDGRRSAARLSVGCAEQVGAHVLGAAHCQHLVAAVLYHRQAASLVDQADLHRQCRGKEQGFLSCTGANRHEHGWLLVDMLVFSWLLLLLQRQ
jgi:hypothetical protein